MRYTVSIDFYVHAESDADAKKYAEIAKIMLAEEFEHPEVVSIHETPFGTIGIAREIEK